MVRRIRRKGNSFSVSPRRKLDWAPHGRMTLGQCQIRVQLGPLRGAAAKQRDARWPKACGCEMSGAAAVGAEGCNRKLWTSTDGEVAEGWTASVRGEGSRNTSDTHGRGGRGGDILVGVGPGDAFGMFL